MEDHETRRKVIRQWMLLPKDKRHTAEQGSWRRRRERSCHSVCDLYPVLADLYAKNKRRLDSGEHPPVAQMFAADIVFAAWPSAPGKISFRCIKGATLLKRALGGENADYSVDALPCSSRADAGRRGSCSVTTHFSAKDASSPGADEIRQVRDSAKLELAPRLAIQLRVLRRRLKRRRCCLRRRRRLWWWLRCWRWFRFWGDLLGIGSSSSQYGEDMVKLPDRAMAKLPGLVTLPTLKN